MKRKLIKGVLTFTLLLAMLVTMANPVSIYAEELATDDEQTEANDTADDNQDFDDEQKESQESEGTVGTEKTGNGQYDTTKPVIEKVEFPQQGTTVKADETIRLYVYAYDTETEEGELKVSASIVSESFLGNIVPMESSYDAEKGCYVCEYALPNTSAQEIRIFSIGVTDKAGNYTDYSCYEEGDYKYWVSVEQQESQEIHIKKFELKQNGQTLDENGVLEMTLETEEEIEGSIYASFQCKNTTYTSTREFYFSSVNPNNKKGFKSNNTVGSNYSDGTWTLQGIYVKKDSLGKKESLNIDDIGECKYIVKKTESNVTKSKPVITSVSLDKNGEMLSAGDKVNITIGAVSDEGKLNEYGYVNFQAVSHIANSSKKVDVHYDEEKGVYEGVLEVTKDTYPCEWYVESIWIKDTENNSADSYAFTREADYPYYIQVTNGNTFVNPTYDINISFRALNESGEWETVQEVQKKVERRQTLKEIGITFPEMKSKYPGFTQIGWTEYNGDPITEDTQILGNSSHMSIRAKYDKRLVPVYYQYRKADGNVSYQKQKIEVTEDMTCGEVREMVEGVAAPKESYKGMVFQKWQMRWRCNCTDESLFNTNHNSDYVFIDAVYDKACMTVEYTYADTEGNWSRKAVPLVFGKEENDDTIMKRAQEYIPEDITKEYKFEQWEKISFGSIDDYADLNLRAKFSGKIVLEVEYRDCFDKKGNEYPLRGLFVDEGTTGKDVIKTLNENKLPEFYPGLIFKEWEITGIRDNAIVTQGKHIDVKAIYENCLVRYIIDPAMSLPAWGSVK